MRKSFITKEYEQVNVPGTWSLKMKKHFSGSLLPNVPKKITLTGADEWLTPTPYVAFSGQLSHIYVSVTQNKLKNSWSFNIDIPSILREHVYRKMWGEFDIDDPTRILSPLYRLSQSGAVLNYSTSEAVRMYVNTNVLPLYELTDIVMYAKYYDLVTTTVAEPPYDIQLLKNGPVASRLSRTGKTQADRERTVIIPSVDGKYTVDYLQTGDPNKSIFLYDFDYVFSRI